MIRSENIENWVRAAKNGDEAAFDLLVFQLQNLCVGVAFSYLGDWHLAQDAAQEALIEARFQLHRLENPAQFVLYLRSLIFKHCDRLTRRKTLFCVALEGAEEVGTSDLTPPQWSERGENQNIVRREIAALPKIQREVVVLFYIGEHSYREVAEFLDLPVSTVKKRLYDARQSLKRKLTQMFDEELGASRPSNHEDFARDVKRFTSEFSQLISSGESLVKSLFLIANRENGDFAVIASQIQHDLTGDGKTGLTLSQALAKHPLWFDASYVQTIHRAENEGNLALTIRQLAQ